MISGPNDAIHVVWALSKCFFKIIHCFFKTNYNYSEVFECTQMTVTPSFGPRYYSTTPNRQHDHLNMATSPHQATSSKQQGMMRARDAPAAVSAAYEKRPKRRETRHLGPLVSFFKIILRCFLILTSIVLRFSNVTK